MSNILPEFIKVGYGCISRKVMRCKKLSIEAKAIYSYLISFAGDKYECYPKLDMILSELDLGKNRFYKNLKQLIDFGLIKTKKTKVGNKWDKTLYIIENVLLPQFEEVQFEDIQNETLIVTGKNSNNKNNKNIIYINLQEIDEYIIKKYLKEYKNKFGVDHFRVSDKHRDTIENLTMLGDSLSIQEIDIAIEEHFNKLPENNNGSILYFSNTCVLTRIFNNTATSF